MHAFISTNHMFHSVLFLASSNGSGFNRSHVEADEL